MNTIALDSVLGSVPQLASGGIVDHATLLVAGEQGPEAIIPLDKGFGGGQTQEISIYLDSDRIAKSTVQKMPRIVRMQGVMTR